MAKKAEPVVLEIGRKYGSGRAQRTLIGPSKPARPDCWVDQYWVDYTIVRADGTKPLRSCTRKAFVAWVRKQKKQKQEQQQGKRKRK